MLTRPGIVKPSKVVMDSIISGIVNPHINERHGRFNDVTKHIFRRRQTRKLAVGLTNIYRKIEQVQNRVKLSLAF